MTAAPRALSPAGAVSARSRGMLRISELTYRIAGRALFHRASVTVSAGQKVGLVGPNGAGKSTLLKLIAGDLTPDEGEIDVPNRWRIATVAQHAPDGPDSLIDTVLAADEERTGLLAEADTATDADRLGEIHARLIDIDAHAAPARAAQILAGLGFDEAAQHRPCASYSGGFRMRVALAATLFLEPDLLLLDEPTNHLDLEAAIWLESWLSRYPHTVVLVSHDRGLLNRAVEGIVHLDAGQLRSYGGSYDRFEKTRALERDHLAARAAKQEAQRKHLQAFVDRFRYKASKATQAQSRIKMLEKMEPIALLPADRTVSFDFPSPEPPPPPLITLDDVTVGYGSTPVLQRLNLRLDPDDRIALLGANGNGKSTLAKLLSGRLAPLDGRMTTPPKLTVGYFAQHQTEELDPARTALAETAAWMPDATDQHCRDHLGRFGFSKTKAETPIGALSGGEKARLLFALITRMAPHMLILDEPTNHLDIDSRKALVAAINAYRGAVVLISHDQSLVELTAERLWLVAGGTCRAYDGDMAQYRKLLFEQRRAERNGTDQPARSPINGATAMPADRKAQRQAAAALRSRLAPFKKRVAEAERAIEQLTRQKVMLEQRLADPAIYDGSTDQVTALQKQLGAVLKDLDAAETAWLGAQDAYENAQLGQAAL